MSADGATKRAARKPVERALLSVFDATGLLPFAQALASLRLQLIATGQTRALLDEGGVATADVSQTEARDPIGTIDLLCINLCPLERALAMGGAPKDVLSLIDMGGASLIRMASRKHTEVTVVVDPVDYPQVLDSLRQCGRVRGQLRAQLAAKAFALMADYDRSLASFLGSAAYLQRCDSGFFEGIATPNAGDEQLE